MTHEELTLNIEKALEEIRPFLNSDGGDIKLVSIDGEKHVKISTLDKGIGNKNFFCFWDHLFF